MRQLYQSTLSLIVNGGVITLRSNFARSCNLPVPNAALDPACQIFIVVGDNLQDTPSKRHTARISCKQAGACDVKVCTLGEGRDEFKTIRRGLKRFSKLKYQGIIGRQNAQGQCWYHHCTRPMGSL